MRKWLVRGGIALAVILILLGAAGWYAARHFEPYIREQAVSYLEGRFGPGVELKDLHVSVRFWSPWKPMTARLVLSGESLRLPMPHRPDLPPLIVVSKFSVRTELGELWASPRRIHDVQLRKLEINIPPREDRPAITGKRESSPESAEPGKPVVVVEAIHADDANLQMFPSDPEKEPRLFEIHHLILKGVGAGKPMKYEAVLTNPKPRGVINVSGDFGPWERDDPGQTRISGSYTFRDADMSVFHSIAGMLQSTGKFDGVLERIGVHGEANVPDFRLAGGNPVPLATKFDSIVDGTSGDTFLEPVRATLGRSSMECRGKIVKPKGAKARSIVLNVSLPKGRIEDLVRLAVKSPKPFLDGEVALKTKLQILPAPGQDLMARLVLDGDFSIEQAHFVGGSVQEKVDELSRRAQGQPKNESIEDVWSAMRGDYHMQDGVIQFSNLAFQAPGAAIHLHGSYGIDSEEIDLHGVARLRAKVSQTMTGWKRIVLKPIDPFFSKNGAGTVLPIQVTGSRKAPKFGLEHKKGDKEASADRTEKQ
jgi:hypothetical protein